MAMHPCLGCSVVLLTLAVPAAAFTPLAPGASLPGLRLKPTTALRGAAFDGLPDLGSLISGLSESVASSVALPALPPLELQSLLAPGVASSATAAAASAASALSDLLSHVDPALQPLLVAPPLLFALAVFLDQWDQIGNGFESATPDGGTENRGSSSSAMAAPFRGGRYNEEAATAFYGARPLVVAKRLLTLASLTSTFNAKLFRDYLATPQDPATGKKATPWVGEAARAKEALVLANALGPTFIKLGQAASIRTDLIPEPYALELRQLQDAVRVQDGNSNSTLIPKTKMAQKPRLQDA